MKNIKILFLASIVLFLFTKCSVEESPTPTMTPVEEVIEIQPSSKIGQDAVIWSSRPDESNGAHQDFQAMAWTWSALGLPSGMRRSLIKFDLSDIPSDAIVSEAYLNLYHNVSSPDFPSTEGHSNRSGSNESVLNVITSDWDEMTVTWNNQPSTTKENQIVLPESIDPKEDYKIDVTSQINDMLKDRSSNHGFMFSLMDENYYRAMIFASSDHEDETLHPKLVVKYVQI